MINTATAAIEKFFIVPLIIFVLKRKALKNVTAKFYQLDETQLLRDERVGKNLYL